jgi:hypothetical protein
VHIENFQKDGANKLPSKKNTPHMHDQFGMIPEEIKKIVFSISRQHLSTIACEPTRESHFQHPEHILRDDTKMVLRSFQH